MCKICKGKTLDTIEHISCFHIKEINIPNNVRFLYLLDCANLLYIKSNNSSLSKLSVSYCPKLISIDTLPTTLNIFHCFCNGIRQLPKIQNRECMIQIWNCRMLLNVNNLNLAHENISYTPFWNKDKIKKIIKLQRFIKKILFKRKLSFISALSKKTILPEELISHIIEF